jgi:hypothetical protein
MDINEEPWMLGDDIDPKSQARINLIMYSLPFDPISILRESHESTTLEELDAVNSTNSRKFIQTCSEDILHLISSYCMEDPRLWDIYWEVIYDAAVEIEQKTITANEKEIDNDQLGF